MEALYFNLRGDTAFFKNPEVNSELYYTYGCIHKPALLGIFGAILGYGGYAQQYAQKTVYPEYYEKLRNLHVSIVPLASTGTFAKKIQTFNNSVGYASKEEGGNLVVNEVWLENPSWDIYVLLDQEQARLLSEFILNKKNIYSPFLGKNDHPATISNARIVSISPIEEQEFKLDSIGIEADFDIVDDPLFCYQEYLPVRLSEETNFYELEKFFFADYQLEAKGVVYHDEQRKLAFF